MSATLGIFMMVTFMGKTFSYVSFCDSRLNELKSRITLKNR